MLQDILKDNCGTISSEWDSECSESGESEPDGLLFINPRRACAARVTVVVLCLCVCVCA